MLSSRTSLTNAIVAQLILESSAYGDGVTAYFRHKMRYREGAARGEFLMLLSSESGGRRSFDHTTPDGMVAVEMERLPFCSGSRSAFREFQLICQNPCP